MMTEADITPANTSSKTVLITGPTQGLGRLTTLELASMGCRLILLGRPSAAFDRVVRDAATAGSRSVIPIEFDAASLTSVTAATASVVRALAAATATATADDHDKSVDAVIANAGVQMSDRMHRSADGFELTFAVNVLSVHRLISGLLPVLSAAANVVLVGSGTHFGTFPTTSLVAGPVWADPATLAMPGAELPPGRGASGAKAGQCAYSTSKLAVNYLMHAANREHAELRVNVFDPGMMPGTGLARDLPAAKRFMWNRVMPSLVPIIPGASKTSTSARHLAALTIGRDHPEARDAYVEIDHMSKASDASFNPQRESELWAFCENAAVGGSSVGVVSSPPNEADRP
jgi:NAD(P)-dependent dehydrogenase (short-subunit alcohol dehydrogenase family)